MCHASTIEAPYVAAIAECLLLADTLRHIFEVSSMLLDHPFHRSFYLMQVDAGKLKAYYVDAYAAVRKWAPDCFFVVSPRNWEQDGGAWQNFMAGPQFTKVLQDVHRCECTVGSAVQLETHLPRVRGQEDVGAVTAERSQCGLGHRLGESTEATICISRTLFRGPLASVRAFSTSRSDMS